MEALYLLFSIVSTTITTSILSLLLLFRLLLRRLSPRATASSNALEQDAVVLYQGTVWHERRRPVHHAFRYSVRYALIDLDRAPHTVPDHLSADEARRFTGTAGPVFLLTVPPSVGYEQNPLSLYYCYELDGSTRNLKKCIAEVTNTPWGERVNFVFSPTSDLIAKPLHVSPFMDMLGNWNIIAKRPGDDLSVTISVQHPDLGDYFTATLKAKRVSASDHALFFWLMPHKVAMWIYWQALMLWWKNMSFIQHPRYTNPLYKEEATLRDKLQCPLTMGPADIDLPLSDFVSDRNVGSRRFTWRDAKWPWS